MEGEAVIGPRKEHILKTDPEVFQDVLDGRKPYEIRFDDRGFHKDDTLILQETKHTGEAMKKGMPLEYTGREIRKRISHILRGPIYGLKDGWVIMSFATRRKVGEE